MYLTVCTGWILMCHSQFACSLTLLIDILTVNESLYVHLNELQAIIYFSKVMPEYLAEFLKKSIYLVKNLLT